MQQQSASGQRAVDDGPGANQRFVGGILIAVGVAIGVVWFVVAVSPFSPAKVWRRIEGVDDLTQRAGLVLLIATVAVLASGLALYGYGVAVSKRAR